MFGRRRRLVGPFGLACLLDELFTVAGGDVRCVAEDLGGHAVEVACIETFHSCCDGVGDRLGDHGLGSGRASYQDHAGLDLISQNADSRGDVVGVSVPGVFCSLLEPSLGPSSGVTAVDVEGVAVDRVCGYDFSSVDGGDIRSG